MPNFILTLVVPLGGMYGDISVTHMEMSNGASACDRYVFLVALQVIICTETSAAS